MVNTPDWQRYGWSQPELCDHPTGPRPLINAHRSGPPCRAHRARWWDGTLLWACSEHLAPHHRAMHGYDPRPFLRVIRPRLPIGWDTGKPPRQLVVCDCRDCFRHHHSGQCPEFQPLWPYLCRLVEYGRPRPNGRRLRTEQYEPLKTQPPS